MRIDDVVLPTGSGLDPIAVLDGLMPGLAAALLDLLDAVDDRCDCGLDARAVLVGVCRRVLPSWESLPVESRVLAVLDAVRVVLGQR